MAGIKSEINQGEENSLGIYKRGGVWWYKFMFNGQLVRHSTKQGNNKTALNMESAHRTSRAKDEVGIREKKIAPTFKDFCDKRIEPYAKPRQSWIWYRAGMRAPLKYGILASARLDEIKGETAAGFAAWRLGRHIGLHQWKFARAAAGIELGRNRRRAKNRNADRRSPAGAPRYARRGS